MTRTVLVTGAAGGIGSAIVRQFESDGWTVVAADIGWPADTGRPASTIELDVTDAAGVADAVGRIPRLDAVVNNAGVMIVESGDDASLGAWDMMLNVNVRGAFAVARAAAPALRRTRGSITNIASVHARATSIGVVAYAASKGAVCAMSRALALDLAPDGVRVNCVLPGAIDTAMLESGLSRAADRDAARHALVANTPLGRLGRPEDVAQAVAFLADETRSGFMTGHELVVDGGVLSRLASE